MYDAHLWPRRYVNVAESPKHQAPGPRNNSIPGWNQLVIFDPKAIFALSCRNDREEGVIFIRNTNEGPCRGGCCLFVCIHIHT